LIASDFVIDPGNTVFDPGAVGKKPNKETAVEAAAVIIDVPMADDRVSPMRNGFGGACLTELSSTGLCLELASAFGPIKKIGTVSAPIKNIVMVLCIHKLRALHSSGAIVSPHRDPSPEHEFKNR
jgi:hypothetical protein